MSSHLMDALFDVDVQPVVTVVGTSAQWGGFRRYELSNGWFADAADLAHHRYQGWKYSLWEPGGDPSGCAGYRGGAPTLRLLLAVANGADLCGMAEWGCRKTAVGYRTVTVRGTQGRVCHCEDHVPEAGP